MLRPKNVSLTTLKSTFCIHSEEHGIVGFFSFVTRKFRTTFISKLHGYICLSLLLIWFLSHEQQVPPPCFSVSWTTSLPPSALYTHTHKLLSLWRRYILNKGAEFECYFFSVASSFMRDLKAEIMVKNRWTWKPCVTASAHWFSGWFIHGFVGLVTEEKEEVWWTLDVIYSGRTQSLAGEHDLACRVEGFFFVLEVMGPRSPTPKGLGCGAWDNLSRVKGSWRTHRYCLYVRSQHKTILSLNSWNN